MNYVLRDYQEDMIGKALTCLESSNSTLAVAPTGAGKTVSFVHLAKRFHEKTGKRVCIAAHRQELIFQTAEKAMAVFDCGEPQIEMGDWKNMPSRHPILVTSIQTMSREGRYSKFNPNDFGLLIVDEAHHCVPRCQTYNAVVKHFQKNPALKLFGCTATPDRLDEKALGAMFDSVCYESQLPDAIAAGWLVPIDQCFVRVEHLDLSLVRKQGDDFHEGDLAAVMNEKVLHEIARPTYELSEGRPTLVFTPPRPRRERNEDGSMPEAGPSPADILAAILNGYESQCAVALDANTPKDARAEEIKGYSKGRRQFLVSCGLFLEGFDAPNTGVIAMARPTLSRSLYSQAIGRGTRTLAGVVDGLETAQERTEAIFNSGKRSLLVIDFCGQNGSHKLISVGDILGGRYEDDVVARAIANAKESDGPADMTQALEKAQDQISHEEHEAEKKRQALRSRLDVKATYQLVPKNPFELFEAPPNRRPGYYPERTATAKQMETLRKFKLPEEQIAKMGLWEASQALDLMIGRAKKGLCSYKQAMLLRKNGVDPKGFTFEAASAAIDRIAKEQGWAPRKAVPA